MLHLLAEGISYGAYCSKAPNFLLEDRKAYKHNHHLRQLMIDCGCEAAEGVIKVTRAASINDSFWMKAENESVVWNDLFH